MYRFIESIQIKNSVPLNIELHSARMNKTRFDVLGLKNELNISNCIDLPHELKTCKKVKCRVIYSKEIEDIQYREYSPKIIKKIKLVLGNEILYNYKYLDRTHIVKLTEGIDESCEILIVKNGCLTDTSIHNIALFDGYEWHTPLEPLLCGVQREYLLEKGIIISKKISKKDIIKYSVIRLFNAMNSWDECQELSTNCIE